VIAVVGCSSGDDDADDASGTTDTSAVADVVVIASDFKPLAEMTRVRGFFVDNVAGDLDGTLAVANDPEGGTYPAADAPRLTAAHRSSSMRAA
jgi:hypothetical protein